jgi:hypothetical protein
VSRPAGVQAAGNKLPHTPRSVLNASSNGATTERFFDLLFLGGADDVVENAGIIVDVAIVDVIGEFHLIFERLPLIAHPLGDDEAAERDQRA